MLSHLFSPLTIRGRVVRNRILSTGHDTTLPTDGTVNAALIAYHRARAKGGVGLIVAQHDIDRGDDEQGQRRLLIEHRQRTGHAEADRADVPVRRAAKRRRAGAEHLRRGAQLTVDLDADDGLVAIGGRCGRRAHHGEHFFR